MSEPSSDQQFAPHDPVDFRNQNTMFLVLEEFGIACMQDDWIRKNDPQNKDAEAGHRQAKEFFDDLHSLLLDGDIRRVIANGWTGVAIAAHLKKALAPELEEALHSEGSQQSVAELSDSDVIARALSLYRDDLRRFATLDAHEKAAGRKVPPKVYIDFMVAWSGVFSGKNASLVLPDMLTAFGRDELAEN
jgi:hypothetical protein